MRTAQDIVQDYRARGYDDKRLRALANNRPEPIRSEILSLLEAEDTDVTNSLFDVPQENLPTVAAAEEQELALPQDPAPQPEVEATATATEPENALVSPEATDIKEDTTTHAEENELNTDLETESAEEPVALQWPPVTMVTIQNATSLALDELEMLLVALEAAEEKEAVAKQNTPEGVEETMVAETSDLAQEQGDLFMETTDVETLSEEVIDTPETEVAECLEQQDNQTISPIVVRHLSPDEYFSENGGPLGVNVIDLRQMDETIAEILMDENETVEMMSEDAMEEVLKNIADIKVESDETLLETATDIPVGELWPSADAVDSIAHQENQLASIDSSILYLFPQDETDANDIAQMHDHPAAQRSLEVLSQMDTEDTPVAELTESNIIPLNAPYACTDEMITMEGDESQILWGMNDEESRLIKFPTDMLEMWDAINLSNEPEPMQNETVAASDTHNVHFAQMEEELAGLQRWVAEVEEAVSLKDVELKKMAGMVQEREETLEVQSEEMRLLRDELDRREERLTTLQDEDQHLHQVEISLREMSSQMEDLEREYNIIFTETVPNLQKDKDDLLDMLEEKTIQESHLQTSLMTSRRRTALGYSLAAAAAILVLAMPALTWMQTSQTESSFALKEKHYQAQLEQAERLRSALEQEQGEKLAALEQRLAMEKTAWTRQKDTLEARLRAQREQFAQLQQNRGDMALAGAGAPSQDAVETANHNLTGTRSLREETSDHLTDNNRRPYNNVQGISQWMAQRTRQSQQRVAVVRPNDGLSHVLVRELGRCTPELLKWVAKKNGLRHDRHGNPLIYPKQKLTLPAPGENVAQLP